LNNLWREFSQHLVLRPPQDERCNPLLQTLDSLYELLRLF
jgi:hypothetical protein